MKFGEHLCKNNLIPLQALSEGLETQRFRPEKLGRVLRNLGYLSQAELDRQLHLFHLPKKGPSLKSMSAALKSRLGQSPFSGEIRDWADDHGWILSDETEHGLSFFSPWYNDEFLEEAEARFKKPCGLVVVTKEGVNLIRLAAGLELPTHEESKVRLTVQATDDQKIGATDPYTSLFRDTVLAARELKASDIHLQPTRDGLSIRLRVNGDMLTWKELALEHRRAFINEVKRLTNLSIAVSGRAQDGRVSFKGWELDLRASLLPSQYGEKIVLRLLDLTRRFDLESLGFDKETHGDLLTALQAKNGVLLVSGPTGSGKTTTLYTLLCALDRRAKNIITLEDPIEYGIEGLTQVQVSRKLSFADALRSVLRQDPDVILVGEIRDAETADLCVKAASTGHLVLSTLHANGAAEVIGRIMNLGIDPYMLKSVLRFSAAQRLIKKLCPQCSKPEPIESVATALPQIGIGSRQSLTGETYRRLSPDGCRHCKQGVVGRVPVLEYMRASDINAYLTDDAKTVPHVAVSLQEATLRRAEKGEVDFHEILEVN